MSTKPVVEIEIQDYGTIRLELEPEHAPITTKNFIILQFGCKDTIFFSYMQIYPRSLA